MLEIITLPVLTDNYIYIIHDSDAKQTAVVDPALAEPVLEVLNDKGWSLDYILNTHHHSDHIGGNLALKRLTGCKIAGAKADSDRIPGIDLPVDDGYKLALGGQTVEVMATPGHTRSHIVYFFSEQTLLFCGDTLFAMGCGRLFEGTPAQMWHSLNKIKTLPVDTQIYCAHEYTQTNGRFALTVEPGNARLRHRMIEVDRLRGLDLPTIPTTLDEELATNPFLRVESSEIQQNLGLTLQNPVEIFARLRCLKNNF